MATILIIDDSPTELHLFQNMLEKSGFATLVADSGEDGIRQAEASRPDCILMDVVMPGMIGFTMYSTAPWRMPQILSVSWSLVVIMMTGMFDVRGSCVSLRVA